MNIQKNVAGMIRFVSITVLVGMLGLVTGKGRVEAYKQTVPKTHNKTSSKKSHLPRKVLMGLNTIKASYSKDKIRKFYENEANFVSVSEITLDGKPLLCYNVDTGSGAYIIWSLIYIQNGKKWSLAYKHDTSPKRIGVIYKRKNETLLEVIGVYMKDKITNRFDLVDEATERKTMQVLSVRNLLENANNPDYE